MAFNLREYVYQQMIPRATSRNGETVDITYADGTSQTGVNAQVLYDTEAIDPEEGVLISVKKTFVTVAIYDLDQAKENIRYIKYPSYPGATTQKSGMFDGSKAAIDGESAGFIRIPITETEQS